MATRPPFFARVNSVYARESHPGGMRIGTVHGNHKPDHVERADIADLHVAIGQFIEQARSDPSYAEHLKPAPGMQVDDVYTVDGRLFRRLIQGFGDACVEIERHNQNSEAFTRTEKLDAWRALTHDAIKVDPGRFVANAPPSANAAIAEGQARRADGWLEVPGMAPVNAQEVRAIADARDRFRQERDAAHIRIRQAIHLLYNAMGQHHRGAADDGVRDAIGTLEPTGESASFEAATPNPAPMTLGHDGLLRPGAPSNVEGCPSNECQIRRQCTGTPCRMGSAMATSAAVRDANRAAAALAGHPDPVPLIEKMTKPQRVPVRATSGEVTGYRDGSSPDPVAQEAHAAGERPLREHAAREGISTATPPPDEHRLIIAQRMLVLADQRALAGDHVGACECVSAYYTLLALCPPPVAR